MRTLRFLSALLMALCSFAALPAVAENEVPWPGVDYAFVRAYLHGGEAHVLREIVRDGNLSSSVEQVQRLSNPQVTALLATIQAPPGIRTFVGACFDPHHAVVFFDKFSRPVAWMNVCFTCGNYKTSPSMPSGKILNLEAVEAIFRELKIPVGKDAAYQTYLAKADSTIVDESPEFFDLWGSLPKPGSAALADSVAHWPWREVATVKLYEFNLQGRDDSIVHLGKVSADVAVERQLTDAQRKAVWAALRVDRWHALGQKQELRIEVGGRVSVRPVGFYDFWSDFTHGQPRLFRHALVCLDSASKPVAWLNLSFSDGRYTSNPTEGSELSICPVWHLDRLASIFKEAGIPVRTAEEYLKLEEETRKKH